MGPEEDDDDERQPLPDPTLRAWRHPSELASVAAMAAGSEPSWVQRRRLSLSSLLLGGALGALSVLAVLAVARLVVGEPPDDRFELREAAASSAPAGGDGDPPSGAGDPAPTAAPTTTASLAPTSAPAAPPPDDDGAGGPALPALPAGAIVGVGTTASSAPLATGLVVDRLVVTSASAIGGAAEVTLAVAGGTYRGSVIGRDSFTDIAVIDPDADAPLAELPPAGPVAPDAVVALVATDGRPEPITVLGRVTGWGHTGETPDGHDLIGLLTTSARLPTAGVGALLLDAHGGLVGMVVNSPGHLAVAVPEATVRLVARSLRDTGHPAPVWLGVSVLERYGGVEVSDVAPGGPAEAAGLRRGDQVTAVDGLPLPDLASFFAAVRAHQPGDRLALGVTRDGEELVLDVVLAAPPAPAPPTAHEEAAE